MVLLGSLSFYFPDVTENWAKSSFKPNVTWPVPGPVSLTNGSLLDFFVIPWEIRQLEP